MRIEYIEKPLKKLNITLIVSLFYGEIVAFIAYLIINAAYVQQSITDAILSEFGFGGGPSVGTIVLIIVLACAMVGVGIYLVFQMENMMSGINYICDGDHGHTIPFALALFLGVITLDAYLIYYIHKQYRRLCDNSDRYCVSVDEGVGTTVVILYIVKLTMPLAWWIVMKNYNRMVEGYNDSLERSPSVVSGNDMNRDYTVPQRQGKLRCTAGELAGASIILENGREIVIGRQADAANLVLSSAKVSKIHCSVSYDSDANQFYITDHSKNGTKLLNGSALLKGIKTPVSNHTEFELADHSRFIVTS